MTDAPRFDPDTGQPDYLYRKLADHIAELVSSGVEGWQPGDWFPHWTELVLTFCIPPRSVDRTVDLLTERGVIGRGSRGGLIIYPPPPTSDDLPSAEGHVVHLAWLTKFTPYATRAGLTIRSHDAMCPPQTVHAWRVIGPDSRTAANETLTSTDGSENRTGTASTLGAA